MIPVLSARSKSLELNPSFAAYGFCTRNKANTRVGRYDGEGAPVGDRDYLVWANLAHARLIKGPSEVGVGALAGADFSGNLQSQAQ